MHKCRKKSQNIQKGTFNAKERWIKTCRRMSWGIGNSSEVIIHNQLRTQLTTQVSESKDESKF